MVEGVVLKAAWLWVRDYSVVNEPLWEPARTLLYVDLPCKWGSVVGDQMFSSFFVGGTLTDINERINLWL